jgi:hypothetical protein
MDPLMSFGFTGSSEYMRRQTVSSISIGRVLYFCLSLRFQDKFWMHAMSLWKGKDLNEENVQSLAAAAADAYIAEHELVPL